MNANTGKLRDGSRVSITYIDDGEVTELGTVLATHDGLLSGQPSAKVRWDSGETTWVAQDQIEVSP